MARGIGLLGALLLLIMGVGLPGRAAAELPCKAIADIALPHASVTKVAVETLGETKACRFQVTSKPTSDSDIRIEVWIPIGAAWNGKYVQIGNGGFAGQIPSAFLQAIAARGYAVAGTDDGHQSSVGTDASWALRHPEKVTDFGWRALKETTENAKLLIAAVKGSGPQKSYFTGCSDGGREALMEAQRFPNDFDGVVAGAPANNFTHLLAGAAWSMQALLNTPGAYIAPSHLAILQEAALRHCGGAGGYIPDPMSCRFDPGVVQCRPGQDAASCLSPAQVAAARAIYGGPVAPDGHRLFPGYSPGAEAEPGAWAAWITGPSREHATEALIYQFGSGFFRNMAFADPKFDILKLGFGGSFQSAKAATGEALDSVDPDLRAFRAHGGKLIQYHGWNDPAIPALSSIVYYEDVTRTMGDVSGFYRLFMVPGMLHCGGGQGPGAVDWLTVLEDWVVRGQAPDAIVATNAPSPMAPRPETPAAPRSQRLCPYPAIAQGPDVATSRCVAGLASSPQPPARKPPPPRLRRRY